MYRHTYTKSTQVYNDWWKNRGKKRKEEEAKKEGWVNGGGKPILRGRKEKTEKPGKYEGKISRGRMRERRDSREKVIGRKEGMKEEGKEGDKK